MAVTHYKVQRGQYTNALCGRIQGYYRDTDDKARVTCKRCLKALGFTVVKVEKPTVPAQVQAELERMFGKVEPEFKLRMHLRYKDEAESQLKAWQQHLRQNDTGMVGDPRGRMREIQSGQYVRYPSNGYCCEPRFWAQKRESASLYYADYVRAEKDADRAVDQARQQFLYRQGLKIATALSGRTDLKTVSGNITTINGVVEGSINVFCANGDGFGLYTRLIVNCRTSPQYLTFFQYPSRFFDIKKHEPDGSGYVHGAKSEAWMKGNF